MYKHRVFAKGEQVHCLLSSFNHPNILIPVKAIIKDGQWDSVNPRYQVRIIKFYDSIQFLKKYLFDMNFNKDFTKKARKFPLKPEDFKKVKDIEERLKDSDEARFYVVVDSIMTVKTKADLRKLFDKIQHFLITKKLSECMQLSTRSFFTGALRTDSEREFKMRLRKFMEDRFEMKGEDFNRWLKGL